MLNRVCKELVEFLKEAIIEIRAHNADYHHVTRPDKFAKWEDLISKLEKTL